MMILALHSNQIATFQILPRNQNVNHEVYVNFLRDYVLPYVREHRIRTPLIMQDNARPHMHHKVRAFMGRHRWVALDHPPHSPDIHPADFDAIARIKRPNKGIRFKSETELRDNYTETINEINQSGSSIGISLLPQRWRMVMTNGGEYIV